MSYYGGCLVVLMFVVVSGHDGYLAPFQEHPEMYEGSDLTVSRTFPPLSTTSNDIHNSTAALIDVKDALKLILSERIVEEIIPPSKNTHKKRVRQQREQWYPEVNEKIDTADATDFSTFETPQEIDKLSEDFVAKGAEKPRHFEVEKILGEYGDVYKDKDGAGEYHIWEKYPINIGMDNENINNIQAEKDLKKSENWMNPFLDEKVLPVVVKDIPSKENLQDIKVKHWETLDEAKEKKVPEESNKEVITEEDKPKFEMEHWKAIPNEKIEPIHWEAEPYESPEAIHEKLKQIQEAKKESMNRLNKLFHEKNFLENFLNDYDSDYWNKILITPQPTFMSKKLDNIFQDSKGSDEVKVTTTEESKLETEKSSNFRRVNIFEDDFNLSSVDIFTAKQFFDTTKAKNIKLDNKSNTMLRMHPTRSNVSTTEPKSKFSIHLGIYLESSPKKQVLTTAKEKDIDDTTPRSKNITELLTTTFTTDKFTPIFLHTLLTTTGHTFKPFRSTTTEPTKINLRTEPKASTLGTIISTFFDTLFSTKILTFAYNETTTATYEATLKTESLFTSNFETTTQTITEEPVMRMETNVLEGALDNLTNDIGDDFFARSQNKPVLDLANFIPSLIKLVSNITEQNEKREIVPKLKEALEREQKLHPTCAGFTGPTTSSDTTSTTTEVWDYEDNMTGIIMGKCYVCGLEEERIPKSAVCADSFGNDFFSLTAADYRTQSGFKRFRKYCRYMDVPREHFNKSDPHSLWGRFTGGCSVRFSDVASIYTQRTCRNRNRPMVGKHFASKRMAKLEMALHRVDNGCIVSPMATLLPLSRAISLFSKFTACVCTGSWCNKCSINKSCTSFVVAFAIISVIL